jgi:hypothetical protein
MDDRAVRSVPLPGHSAELDDLWTPTRFGKLIILRTESASGASFAGNETGMRPLTVTAAMLGLRGSWGRPQSASARRTEGHDVTLRHVRRDSGADDACGALHPPGRRIPLRALAKAYSA